MYICTKRFTLRNQLTLGWRLASPKSAGWVSNLETQEELILQFKLKGRPPASKNPFFLEEISILFVLLRPSTCWIRPTHLMESCLLYTKSTNLGVKSHQKTSSQEHQTNVCQIFGHHGPVSWHMKLTITTFLPNYWGRGYYVLRSEDIDIIFLSSHTLMITEQFEKQII